MFRPVGSQPPTVYWRRRLLLAVSLVALLGLIVLTARVLLSNDAGGTTRVAGGTSAAASPSPGPASTPAPSSPSRTHAQPSPSGKSTGATSGHPSTVRSSASPPPLKACVVATLGLSADTDRTRYSVGDQPILSLLVTNKSATACIQDLADPQIVLSVFNGESRVWDSHDCKVIPGTDERPLAGRATVRVSITWSGLSSQPKCRPGTRQRVGAGTYTLYAYLAGRLGTAAQFAIG